MDQVQQHNIRDYVSSLADRSAAVIERTQSLREISPARREQLATLRQVRRRVRLPAPGPPGAK